MKEQDVGRPAGVGIGLPGPVDFHGGTPVSPPIMPGWDGYPVRDAVARELGAPVQVDNDVNVMALPTPSGNGERDRTGSRLQTAGFAWWNRG